MRTPVTPESLYQNPTAAELRAMAQDEQRLFLCRHGYVGAIHAAVGRSGGACETHAAWVVTTNREAPRMGVLVIMRTPMKNARPYKRAAATPTTGQAHG